MCILIFLCKKYKISISIDIFHEISITMFVNIVDMNICNMNILLITSSRS